MDSSIDDEKQLIENAKKDPKAFDILFEHYYPPILNYVLKRVGQFTVAQDITSDIFFIVFKKLWQFKWRNIPFSAWIYRIANHEVAYYFRKQKRRPLSLEVILETEHWEPADPQDIETEMKEVERELEAHQDFLLIQQELLKLPIKYQEVITLKYFEAKKIREISLILKKRENTVKSLLKRGMELLEVCAKNQKNMQQIFPEFIFEDETL